MAAIEIAVGGVLRIVVAVVFRFFQERSSMTKQIQRRQSQAVAQIDSDPRASVIGAWLRARKETTRRCYLEWLGNFAEWFKGRGLKISMTDTPADAVLDLASLGVAKANAVVQEWVDEQVARGTSRATYAKKYAAVRSFMRALMRAGMVEFVVDIDLPSHEPPSAITLARKYSKTKAAYNNLIAYLEPLATVENAAIEDVRDWAITRTMRDMGLRRTEVHQLDESDLNFEEGTVSILGKGRRKKQDVFLPSSLKGALLTWLQAKRAVGFDEGPLFCSLRGGGRLEIKTYNAILTRRMSEAGGLKLRPHDLRRIFATRAIKKFGLNQAKALTRHKHVSTLEIYDISQGEDLENMAEVAATDEEDET